eukprot:753939-Hanusia_phi.AAC.1
MLDVEGSEHGMRCWKEIEKPDSLVIVLCSRYQPETILLLYDILGLKKAAVYHAKLYAYAISPAIDRTRVSPIWVRCPEVCIRYFCAHDFDDAFLGRKKDFDHKTELHKSRLKNMKPMIDNKPPATTNMKHLQFNRKKREMDFQRYSAIEKENFRLLDKMSRIMVRNAADSVFGEHTNLNCPALDGERARKKKMDKLVEQNQLIGRRLREAKPYYSLAEWDKHTHKTHSLMSHICKYPNQEETSTCVEYSERLEVNCVMMMLTKLTFNRSRSGAESAPPILEGGWNNDVFSVYSWLSCCLLLSSTSNPLSPLLSPATLSLTPYSSAEGDQPSDPNGSAKLKVRAVKISDLRITLCETG